MDSRKTSLEKSGPLGAALPRAQFAATHLRVIGAPPDRVWSALHLLCWRELRLTPVLAAVRGLGVRRRRSAAFDRPIVGPPSPFAPLHQRAPAVMAGGQIGRPWKPRPESGPPVATLDELAAFDEPGWLKFGVEWRLTPIPDGRTLVETTTLAEATDDAVRRRFAAYWSVVGPFSGLIRQDVLAALDRRVERDGLSAGDRAVRPAGFSGQ